MYDILLKHANPPQKKYKCHKRIKAHQGKSHFNLANTDVTIGKM